MLISPNSGVAWRCNYLLCLMVLAWCLGSLIPSRAPWDSGFLLGPSFYLILFYLLTLAQYILLYSSQIPL